MMKLVLAVMTIVVLVLVALLIVPVVEGLLLPIHDLY